MEETSHLQNKVTVDRTDISIKDQMMRFLNKKWMSPKFNTAYLLYEVGGFHIISPTGRLLGFNVFSPYSQPLHDNLPLVNIC